MVTHSYSRGSLHSLVGNKPSNNSDDVEWDRQVIAASMGLLDSMYDDYYEEMSDIYNLWGIYKRAEPIFNEKYFSPRGR